MAQNRKAICFCCLIATAVGLAGSALAGEVPRSEVLVIGKVSDNPRKHFLYLKPIADYAVAQMGDLGIKKAKVLMAKDNETMIRYLKEDKVDWVSETPFSAIQFHQETNAKMVLRRSKKKAPDYHTLFFTRQDNGIETLADLRGRTIALEDSGSTSGYFLPILLLRREKLQVVRLRGPEDKPLPNQVGYRLVGQEINISTWVYKGKVAAGAFNGHDWNKPDHAPPAYKKELRILHRGNQYIRSIELVRDGLAPAITKRLVKVLLEAHEAPKGRRALNAYQKTLQLNLIDDQAAANLKELEEMMRLHGANLEEGE